MLGLRPPANVWGDVLVAGVFVTAALLATAADGGWHWSMIIPAVVVAPFIVVGRGRNRRRSG